ncbi:MAG: metallophosphoesterase [Sulfurifustaceae bacterium]
MKTELSIAGIPPLVEAGAGDEVTDRPDPVGSLVELSHRIGRAHVRERLAREHAHEQRVRRRFGTRFFYAEDAFSAPGVIRAGLRLAGLYARARRNARALTVRENVVALVGLPRVFDGFTLLQISDPHLDLGPDIPDILVECLAPLAYDACVLTGDYRARTFGPLEPTLAAMARVRPHLEAPVYAVLGNHDSIRLVPEIERLGIRVLLNEAVTLERDGYSLYLAGIEDAHHYRMHDFEKAARGIPANAPALLLSHTPEVYREAERAGFRFMLSGHTHGGQICLPGGFPLIIDADCPRRFARGAWRYRDLIGYTSVGSGTSIADVRLNCPPEVTLHRLRTV